MHKYIFKYNLLISNQYTVIYFSFHNLEHLGQKSESCWRLQCEKKLTRHLGSKIILAKMTVFLLTTQTAKSNSTSNNVFLVSVLRWRTQIQCHPLRHNEKVNLLYWPLCAIKLNGYDYLWWRSADVVYIGSILMGFVFVLGN